MIASVYFKKHSIYEQYRKLNREMLEIEELGKELVPSVQGCHSQLGFNGYSSSVFENMVLNERWVSNTKILYWLDNVIFQR